jgi:photosystem II stability/assembly factor-like uncharacterized protein
MTSNASGPSVLALILLLLAASESSVGLHANQPTEPDLGSPIVAQLVSDQEWVVQTERALWETSDGGPVWTTINPPVPASATIFTCFHFLSARTGFIIEGGKFLRTTDGGATWNPLGEVPAQITSFTFADDTHGWAVGVVDSGTAKAHAAAFSTFDGGLTWQHLALPDLGPDHSVLRSAFFYNLTNGWIAGDGSILRTHDGGQHWDIVRQDLFPYQEVFFATEQLGWVTLKDTGEFLLTKDGGEHWVRLSGPPSYGNWPTHVACTTNLHCFVSAMRLYSTNDGGASWKQVSTGLSQQNSYFGYVGISARGELIALGTLRKTKGGAFALTSRDSGATWIRH